MPAKPTHVTIPFGYHEDALFVRIAEGLNTTTSINSMLHDRGEHHITELQNAEWQLIIPLDQQDIAGTMLQRAEYRLQREIADPRQGAYMRLPKNANVSDAINLLNQSPLVEIALPVPIATTASITPPAYQQYQGYENPAAYGGVGAELVWSTFEIHGEGVQVCDLEGGFNPAHCDLPNIDAIGPNTPSESEHGTAVLGVMTSLGNDFGTTGIAYGVDEVKFAALYDNDTSWQNGMSALYQTVLFGVPSGSVILLEIHIPGPNWDGSTQYGYVPVEWYEPYYNAVLYAVGNDVIVCEAAGNGSQDLDASIYSQGNGGHYPFLPENDSGAIMIGAGGAYNSCYGNTWKARLNFSNYGSRVDLQGWGECVMTTGYGDTWDELDCDFTNSFSGTSSATPIVAGACLLVQSYAVNELGSYFLPDEMRTLLIETGQAQVNPSTGHIGPLPDAYAAISSLLEEGACCIDSLGICLNRTSVDCEFANGNWLGAGTTCEDNSCDETVCDSDVDQNGTVDVSDLLVVIDQWGLTDSPADLNGDGIVDVSDLLLVVGNWGPCE
jgi:hypothetical protein